MYMMSGWCALLVSIGDDTFRSIVATLQIFFIVNGCVLSSDTYADNKSTLRINAMRNVYNTYGKFNLVFSGGDGE